MSIKRLREEPIVELFNKKCATLDIEELICPITKEIFNRPVTADDGFTYEEWSIRQILESESDKKISPMTREKISSYCENKIVKSIIVKFLEENPEFTVDQFPSTNYTDYLLNKKYCIKLLFNKNYLKFSEIKNIHLFDNIMYHTTIIKYICERYEKIEVVLFKSILSNSFDLNCKESKNVNTPLYYIASMCTIPYIIAAIETGAEVTNVSEKSLIDIIMENKLITVDNRQKIFGFLLDNGYMLKIFNDKPESLFISDTGYFRKLFDQIMTDTYSFYRFIDINTILNMCYSCSIITTNRLLDQINTMDISIDKLYEYYKNRNITHISHYIEKIYSEIMREIEEEKIDKQVKIDLIKRIRSFLFDRLCIDKLELMLIKNDIERRISNAEELYKKLIYLPNE